MSSLDARFATAMGALLGPGFPSDIALAVSGGGDSMAMLTLAHNWTRSWGVRLWVVTVDHGFRPEAADEAAMVARTCDELGWPHATLRWHWDGQGNKMDAARRARLDLIDRWRGGIAHVLLAHTRDDVAETFLMRLKRGSGAEGLSAIAARRELAFPGERPPLTGVTGARPPGRADAPMQVVRPCLDMGREELRHYLRVLKGEWADDPSNDDPAYDRARLRRLLGTLEPEGLGAERLAATAARLARAREALLARAAECWARIGAEGQGADGLPTGELLIDRDGFAAIEADTQLRLLAGALRWVSSADYRPRAEKLEALLDRLLSGGGGTLHGCEIRAERGRLRIFRELGALAPAREAVREGRLWDRRWLWSGAETGALEAAPLGEEGWRQIPPEGREILPHASARSLPALWDGETLVSCPALGLAGPAQLTLRPAGRDDSGFTAFLLSH